MSATTLPKPGPKAATPSRPPRDESPLKRLALDFAASRLALLGLAAMLLILLVALVAPWISPQNPYDLAQLDIMDGRQPPGAQSGDGGLTFWLGTDDQGRDMLSAIMYGLRISLFVGAGSALIAGVVGSALGLVAAYAGGRTESAVMRLVDLQLSFPSILVALMILAFIGKGIGNVMLALVLVEWAYLRPHRPGLRPRRTQARIHRGRRVPRPLEAPHRLPPPTAQLHAAAHRRRDLPDGPRHRPRGDAQLPRSRRAHHRTLARPASSPTVTSTCSPGKYWISFYPGIALLLTIVAINLVGDQLRDVLNPKLRR